MVGELGKQCSKLHGFDQIKFVIRSIRQYQNRMVCMFFRQRIRKNSSNSQFEV